MAAERIAFIGQDNPRARRFIASANFVNEGPLPNVSPEEKILFLAERIRPLAEEDPQIMIVDESQPEKLLDAARRLQVKNGNGMKSLFAAMTIVDLGTEEHTDYADLETRIRIAKITDEEVEEFENLRDRRMHPTPAT